MTALKIIRPAYVSLDLADALRANWSGWHLSEKMDGVFCIRTFGNSTVTGEAMRDGTFYGFDIVTADNQDVRRRAWRDRSEALIDCAARYGFRLPATGTGAEFVEAVIANGGEGIVAKPLDAAFGVSWFKAKRVETLDATVAELHPFKQSVRLVSDGTDRGWVKAGGGKADLLRVGDVVEIACQKIHTSGKFREPRLIRIRTDKTTIETKA